MNAPTIECIREGGIAEIRLARPERRNALSPRMAKAIAERLRALEDDPSLRILVLRGSGGHFCSGGDLAPDEADRESTVPTGAPPSPSVTTLDLMNRVYGDLIRTLHGFPRPVVALVEGVAAGAGANLAFACDLVYAARSARFSEIFVKRGIALDCGGSWLLPRLIGLQRAKELAFFGDWLSAEEAAAIGLVTQVFDDDGLDDGARERIDALAARAPLALTQIKQSLHRSLDLGMSEALEIEALAQATCTASQDAAEGFRAFVEKREPRFEGR